MIRHAYIFLGIFMLAASVSADDPVKTIIMEKDRELKVALDKYKTNPGNSGRDSVVKLINSIFDFDYMGPKVLPKNVWDSASAAERIAFVREFRRMVELSSVNKLNIYQSDSVFYNDAVILNTKATIVSRVWYKGKSMQMTYKMVKINGDWKAWDLLMDDLSTIRTYREQFTEMLKTKTITDLTEILKKKADELSGNK